jgi:phage terminase small subunit
VGRLKNHKHELFCQAFSKCGNATESYKKAGYKCKDEKTINVNASRLLTNAKVKERIEELNDWQENKAIADIAEIQEALTKIMRDEVEEEVIVLEGQAPGVSVAKKATKKASFTDKVKAMQTLARMQGGFDNTISVTVEIPRFGNEDDLED